MTNTKNQFGKSKKIDSAYATYRVDNPNNGMYFEWKILKTYQVKKNEDNNQYARWHTACKSPMTYDRWEYGDVYIKDIMEVNAKLIDATDEWRLTYATND